ncbi:small multi-drug export protein [Siminovitchia sediminis]|uniref:Small multi-drug export protein n=1 Tax=Siminovitchia sediminis TaxID=1274353 RepID=A0ABW4KI09_9BACI
MGQLWEYILVFLLAAVPWIEIAAVIPLGIIRGLQPVLVVILGFTGNLLTTVMVIFLFESIKNYLFKKGKREGNGKRQARAKKIWNRYGLPGLTLLGPVLIGMHIAAFIGMTLGASKGWTLLWTVISLFLWSIIFGVAAYYGVEAFKVFL